MIRAARRPLLRDVLVHPKTAPALQQGMTARLPSLAIGAAQCTALRCCKVRWKEGTQSSSGTMGMTSQRSIDEWHSPLPGTRLRFGCFSHLLVRQESGAGEDR